MEPYVGEIRLLPFTFAPLGWAFCDGSLLTIAGNEVLFNLIGTTYGGDGQTTFALPDLRSRVPMHLGSGSTLGQSGGVETVGLTTAQMPAHGHALSVSGSGTTSSPVGVHPGLGPGGAAPYGAATGALAADAVGSSTGTGSAHANLQPYLGLSYCISLFGIYPTPN